MQQGVQQDATCNIQSCWLIMLRPFPRSIKLSTNGPNNSKHCWVNKDNVGICSISVGSGAPTPNNVGTCSASWQGYNNTLETMCNARVWPQQCWKSCANGSNIVALRFGDHGTKEMLELLAEKFDRFQTLRSNSQQHATTCNRVCKRTQHVTSNNVRPFARGFI